MGGRYGGGYLDRWWAYPAAFVLMIRCHAMLNILAHEAAHRLLFSRQWLNDAVGISAYKNLKLLARAAVRRKPEALQIVAVQAAMPAVSALTGRPWMYVVWFVS